MRCKFWFFRHYWWILLLLLAVAFGILYITDIDITFKIISALLGTVLSVVYFLQKQKLEEAKLFRDIFKECNSRFDEMNSELNTIMNGNDQDPLDKKQKDLLDDYFNLCGEEYLYYLQGYIYPSVWEAWVNGMRVILQDKRISERWNAERESGSFYNLSL